MDASPGNRLATLLPGAEREHGASEASNRLLQNPFGRELVETPSGLMYCAPRGGSRAINMPPSRLAPRLRAPADPARPRPAQPTCGSAPATRPPRARSSSPTSRDFFRTALSLTTLGPSAPRSSCPLGSARAASAKDSRRGSCLCGPGAFAFWRAQREGQPPRPARCQALGLRRRPGARSN